MIRLGIVGSRKLEGSSTAEYIIRSILIKYKPQYVVSGGAKGIDSMAVDVARIMGYPEDHIIVYPPKPDGPGRSAYVQACFVRNQQIVNDSDAILAVMIEGGSRGTEDTIRKAQAKGIPVMPVFVKDETIQE